MNNWFIEWLGLDKLFNLISEPEALATVDDVKVALMEEAQIMFRNSQRVVPVDTTALRASGRIEPIVEDGDMITVTIGYGGSASDYAMIQHEDLNFHHKEGKTAKYLENPVRERLPFLEANMYKRIQARLDKR